MIRFLKEIKKGLKSPVYLLHSNEPYLLKEAVFEAKRTIPQAERDFLFYTFDREMPEGTIENVIDILYTVPFIEGRRVVTVENCNLLVEKELTVLGHYISKPSPSSVLIMLYQTEKGRFKKSHNGMFGSAQAISLDIREADIPLWIKEKASNIGITLSKEAVDYLIAVIGTDIGLLTSEIEKFSEIGKKTLERKDIEELIRGIGDYDAFDLFKAIHNKDSQSVFKIFKALSGIVEPQMLLGAINYQFTQSKDTEMAKKAFEILHETDIAIKSSGTSYPLEYMLTRLLKL
ncbi:MAG: DNA polymerase III subunit delta [Nitrospirae bacterium]|nr:DNA polymerase III subunit delta [Nitrospirota bacterium]